LNLPVDANGAGMGGLNIAEKSTNPFGFLYNPANQSDSLTGYTGFTVMPFFSVGSFSSITTTQKIQGMGNISFGVRHISYGTIEGTDPSGNPIGNFKTGESAFHMGKSFSSGNFQAGFSMGFSYSSIAGYNASAITMDLGSIFIHPDKELVIGLTFKNLGFLISDFSNTAGTQLPFDIQTGISYKPEHMPVQFNLTILDLTKNQRSILDQTDRESGYKKYIRHLNLGSSFLVSEKINLNLGYNFSRRNELLLNTIGGGAGWSYGFSFYTSRVEFSYGHINYIAGKGFNSFSLVTNLNQLLSLK